MEQQIRKAVLQNPMALDMLQLKEGPVLLENLNVYISDYSQHVSDSL